MEQTGLDEQAIQLYEKLFNRVGLTMNTVQNVVGIVQNPFPLDATDMKRTKEFVNHAKKGLDSFVSELEKEYERQQKWG